MITIALEADKLFSDIIPHLLMATVTMPLVSTVQVSRSFSSVRRILSYAVVTSLTIKTNN